MGCHFLLQGILPSQGLNWPLPQILYLWVMREAPLFHTSSPEFLGCFLLQTPRAWKGARFRGAMYRSWFILLENILPLPFSHSAVSDSLWPQGLQHMGSFILHYLPESAQIHVHWFGGAISPFHPLPPPSPPAFSLSQREGLSSEVALPIKWPKCWSFSFCSSPSRVDFL